MKRLVLRSLVAVAIVLPIAVLFVGISIYNHIDDAYAQWGAADMVIDYMRDHDGDWPRDWDSLQPYFEQHNGRVSGWTYAKFQSHVFIDFDADTNELRRLSADSASVLFDVIHATSIWGVQFDGGPNEMLYRHFGGHREP